MTTVTVADIQRDVVGYLNRAHSGEAILVLDNGKPLAEIIAATAVRVSGQRPFGLRAGEFVVPYDFDEPPQSIIDDFDGR